MDCSDLNATFPNLRPNVWYTCGVNCALGNVRRSIRRSFATPTTCLGCAVFLDGDGISFEYISRNGTDIAQATFEWSVIGTVGFGGFSQCTIDGELPFTCKLDGLVVNYDVYIVTCFIAQVFLLWSGNSLVLVNTRSLSRNLDALVAQHRSKGGLKCLDKVVFYHSVTTDSEDEFSLL